MVNYHQLDQMALHDGKLSPIGSNGFTRWQIITNWIKWLYTMVNYHQLDQMALYDGKLSLIGSNGFIRW